MALFAKKLFDINFLNMETPITVQKFQIDEYHQTYQLLVYYNKENQVNIYNGSMPKRLSDNINVTNQNVALTISGVPAAHTQSFVTDLGTWVGTSNGEPVTSNSKFRWSTAMGLIKHDIGTLNKVTINHMDDLTLITGFDDLLRSYNKDAVLKRLDFAEGDSIIAMQLIDTNHNSYYAFGFMDDFYTCTHDTDLRVVPISQVSLDLKGEITCEQWKNLTINKAGFKDGLSFQGIAFDNQDVFYLASQHAPYGTTQYPAYIIRYNINGEVPGPLLDSEQIIFPGEYIALSKSARPLYSELESVQHSDKYGLLATVAWHDTETNHTVKNVVYQIDWPVISDD